MRERPTTSADPAEAGLFRAELDAALNQLPERYRLPLVLFHLRGLSLDQTAHQLRLNPRTAGTRLARAREILRQKLVRRGVTVGTVGALTTLLSAEAGAAVLTATFASATVQAASLAAAGKLAAGVGTGLVSAKVAALTKGAVTMLFWNSVKSAAMAVAAALVVAGGGVIVAQEVAAQRKAAEQPAAEGNSADRFASPAWRGDDASHDLARVGIRVFQIGGWGPGGASGWATPAELRRRTIPAADYVNAWAASQEREVLWLSDAKVTVEADRTSVNQASGMAVFEGRVKVNVDRQGTSTTITGEKVEYHRGRNTLAVDGVNIPLPVGKVAIIGTKAELDALKQRAGGEAATTEKILALLSSFEGPPAGAGYCRGYWKPEQDQATLRKNFMAAEGKAKIEAAIVLCAAGGDDGLAFLKEELSKQGADTNPWARDAVYAFGVHGGPEAIEMLRAIFLEYRVPTQPQDRGPLLSRAAFALCQNGSDNAVEIIRAALKSDDAATAYWATFGLEFLGGKAGLELAALALAHADPKVRRGGAFGAYRAHGERAWPLLEKALADKDADVRKMVANGLGNIGRKGAKSAKGGRLTIAEILLPFASLRESMKRIEQAVGRYRPPLRSGRIFNGGVN